MKNRVVPSNEKERIISSEKKAFTKSEESNIQQVALIVLWFLLGLVTPRASVYGGMAPFGIALAAAINGPGAVAAYVASFIGYLLPGGVGLPIRYISALVAVAGIKWALSGLTKISEHALFAPIITFISLEFTGFAIAGAGGLNAFKVLIVLSEGLLGAGVAYFFAVSRRVVTQKSYQLGALSILEQSSLVLCGATVLMALSSFTFAGISPGRIIAMIFVLLLAKNGREQGGSISGIVIGVCMAMTFPAQPFLAACFAFGGLMAGMFSRYGRFASAGAFIVANLIVSVSSGSDIVIVTAIYEVLAACILFVIIPNSFDKHIQTFFINTYDTPAVEGLRRSVVMRLDCASKAMEEVADTVDIVSKKLSGISSPDIGTVYRDASNKVCGLCSMKMYCWETEYNNTMDAFNSLTPILRENGRVSWQDTPEQIKKHCKRSDRVLESINSKYVEFAIREGAYRRLSDIRSVVTDQFGSMAEMLEELARDFSFAEQVDNEATAKVIVTCEELGIAVDDAVCIIDKSGMMNIEILAKDSGVRISKEKLQKSVSTAASRVLDVPLVAKFSNTIKISFAEKPKFSVKLGSIQLKCTNETLCGDSFETFSDGTGSWYSVLSDGMGSGGRAAVDGAMASGLTSRLIEAGFGFDSILRMVNSALMIKSSDESLATLDIHQINLFSGKLICRKSGAAPSFLYSKGRVSRIERTALPLGILREVSTEVTEDNLADGDVLLIVSDGVITSGMDWIDESLRDYNFENENMQKFADFIATKARKKQTSKEDDISVIAVQVDKIK